MEVRLNDLTKNGSVTIIVPDGQYNIKQTGASIQISKSGKIVFSSDTSWQPGDSSPEESEFWSGKAKQSSEEETFIKSEFADG